MIKSDLRNEHRQVRGERPAAHAVDCKPYFVYNLAETANGQRRQNGEREPDRRRRKMRIRLKCAHIAVSTHAMLGFEKLNLRATR